MTKNIQPISDCNVHMSNEPLHTMFSHAVTQPQQGNSSHFNFRCLCLSVQRKDNPQNISTETVEVFMLSSLCVWQEWNERAALPNHVITMLNNFPSNLHPMSQFSAAITALNSESKFAKAYADGIKKSKFWEVICSLALFNKQNVHQVCFPVLLLRRMKIVFVFLFWLYSFYTCLIYIFIMKKWVWFVSSIRLATSGATRMLG